jgi:hypothetical protein
MFCPQCRDEFRPGFTRCERCNVDLVEDLSRVERPARAAPVDPVAVRMADYCGFLALDEARSARDRLRGERIRSEIVIREPLDADWESPVREEYWIRADVSRMREVAALVGEVPQVDGGDEPEGTGFACGDCGHRVPEDAASCPSCGARFDD